MGKLEKKLITPESIVIEQTALELAAVYWEIGRSQGLTSKHKTARDFAKANVTHFIPLAVNHLMDMLSSPSISNDQKDLIYSAFMERSNDEELSNIGIKAFENPFADSFESDKVVEQKPVIWNTESVESILGHTQLLDKSNGKEN